MYLKANRKLLLLFISVFMGFLELGIVGPALPQFKYTSGVMIEYLELGFQ